MSSDLLVSLGGVPGAYPSIVTQQFAHTSSLISSGSEISSTMEEESCDEALSWFIVLREFQRWQRS